LYNDAEYQRLIAALESDQTSLSKDGYKLILKAIPDSAIDGDIDPRVLELLLKLQMDPGPETIDLTDLAPLRACMNWKSLDITTMLLNTVHSSFTGRDGNKIRLRIYSPAELSQKLPCILYFHGGGWIGGQMAYVENICKYLAEKIQGVVVSVDYRLAPEDPFPKGFHDCVDAIRFVCENSNAFSIDSNRIGVCGDSAGGNLAAACALYDRDHKKHKIACQALLYPCVNPFSLENPYYTWDENEYEVKAHVSEIRNLCIHELPVKRCMAVVRNAYLSDEKDLKNPYASPLFAQDLANSAPAIIITPEYDRLRLEGEAYARRLAKAGVPTTVVRYRGINHGFTEKVGQYPQSQDSLNEIAKYFNYITASKYII